MIESRNIEKQLLAASHFIKEKEYWLNQLSEFQEKVIFPYDYKDLKHTEREMAEERFKLSDVVYSRLLQVSNESDLRLHAILVASIVLLLHKYCYQSPTDIIVGAPIDKQDIEGEFVNTILTIRNRLKKDMTFKHLLIQVSRTINEAVENQNFPVEVLLFHLNIPYSNDDDFPLFDVVILLENIHSKKDVLHIHTNLTFSFLRTQNSIEGTLEYNTGVYDKNTISRIANHLDALLEKALFNADIEIPHLELLRNEEKEKLLFEFNRNQQIIEPTAVKTIHQWFEDQVAQTPNGTAVSYPLDLNDIHDWLESSYSHPNSQLLGKIKNCCFKKNPYIYHDNLDLSGKMVNFLILKTNRHNSVIVDIETFNLLELFNGERNIASIYSIFKSNTAGQRVLYSMNMVDLLEVSFLFKDLPELFSCDKFEDMAKWIHALYRENLLQLTGLNEVMTAIEYIFPEKGNVKVEHTPLPIENLLKDDDIKNHDSAVQVLLLGDTPGMPSTGLLYLGSYLVRHGISCHCQFYDNSLEYTSLKKNILAILDKYSPDIVAISMKWFLYISRVMDVCKIVKEYSESSSREIKVVVGGNTASYYHEEIIKSQDVDYVILGDGEAPLLKICQGKDDNDIPNCLYKDKKSGEIIQTAFSYIQDETNSSEIYLSDLDKIILAPRISRFGSFFIFTHKGCTMNCLYCGGCNEVQKISFNRKKVLRRNPTEVRKDIIETKKYASTYQFDFDITDSNLVEYCRDIWAGIDLSNHFCIFATLLLPSDMLIDLVSKTFKYVYWDFDICTLSERHRKQLFSLGLVKPQPSDDDLLRFMAQCERYPNIEVRINLINGLPYFSQEDIEPSSTLLSKILHTYSSFGELHWARLHAQPGAPIISNAPKYEMHTLATTFNDFLKYSEKNFDHASDQIGVDNFDYPYIYFDDEHLNSSITNFYLESNRKINQYKKEKKRGLIVSHSLSYSQLNSKARQLAEMLINKGIKPGDIVGLMLERSMEIAIGIIGILKTGSAYMPIDPEFPAGRIEYMLKDSNAALLLTAEDFKNAATISMAGHSSMPQIETTNPVYIIYTSGTSGTPKGVALKHENLFNYVSWFSKKAMLIEEDKTILTTSFAFDLGYTSLYTSLLNGCELHILPRETYLLGERLIDYISQKGITYIKVTPSLFSVIVNAPGFSEITCKSLRLAVIGGESINVNDIEKAYSICKNLKIMNHYGPTETTVGCVATIININQFADYKIHPVIGQPILNTSIYILSRDFNLLPIGIPGELCISGYGVGMGYLNQPELTFEKFLSKSFGQYNTLYRTGDLARWLPNGTIEFLGRIDNQVKVRGYRIELGEIESRLRRHPMVNDALVMVKDVVVATTHSEEKNTDKHICAYIVPQVHEETIPTKTTPKTKPTDQKKEISFQDLGMAKELSEIYTQHFENIAIKSDQHTLTYKTLDNYANRLAIDILEKYDDKYKLSKIERDRYTRQMLLAGWGQASQEKLKSTTVFVAGAGGGASPTVTQLALIGVGTIIICDYDTVELSNLNRQFLHDETRIGMNKALSAQMTVANINPHVKVIPYTEKLTRENVSEMVGNSSIIFDMFDGPTDKFVLSECAAAKQIPHVIISMTDINAYAAVLHPPLTPCYHCLFDKAKLETIISGMKNYVENYSKNPLPVVSTSLFISTGVIVNEALKILLGFEEPAYNKFFYFNQRGAAGDLVLTPGYKAMTHLFSEHFLKTCREQGFDWEIGWRGNFLEEFKITPDPDCPLCGTKSTTKPNGSVAQKINVSPAIPIHENNILEERQQTIALLVNNDMQLAVGILAAIKAEKILVHLYPEANFEELKAILEDSEARLIIADQQYLEIAEKLKERVNKNIKVININQFQEAVDANNPVDSNSLPFKFSPQKIAYIAYSSMSINSFDNQDSILKELYTTLMKGGEYTFTKKKITDLKSLPTLLREYLREQIPEYMIPSHFVPIGKIPLTPNGKIDKKAILEIDISSTEKHNLPKNEVEEKLAGIWAEVLGIDKKTIGTDVTFFSMGGHSLNATIMVSKIHKEFNIKLPLSQVFQTPTIQGLSDYFKTIQKNTFTAIEPVEEKEYYPLSSAQKRMFLTNLMKNKADTSDNTPMVLSVEGRLDKNRLENAAKQLLQRHESLRTCYLLLNDIPIQKVNKEVEFDIWYYEVSNPDEIKGLINGFIQPFDLSKAPLLRVGLLKQAEDKHILMCDMHHIMIDDFSSNIFITEFVNLYEGVNLPPLKIQYKEYSSWQNHLLESGIIKKQEEYWLNVFAGTLPLLNMPTDFPRLQVQSFEGDFILFQFDSHLTSKINQIAQAKGATTYMVLLSIYNILLAKYAGQEDIIVGAPIVGRPHADLAYVIGMFVNTLAFRNFPSGDKTFLEFLEEVKTNTLNGYDNQEYQFEDLINQLHIKPNPGRNPLFDTMFAGAQSVHVNVEAENSVKVIKDLVFKPYEFAENITQFEIIIHSFEMGDVINFRIRYCTKLFKRQTIEDFSKYFKEIATCITENNSIYLKDIKISHNLSTSLSSIFKETESNFEF